MAIDLAAIRKRVSELNGTSRNSSVQLWKPTAGKYEIRGVPWKTSVDGMPFIERRFYYIGGGPGILAPSQFGKPDPINDLIRKLYSSGKPEDREMAKQLQPKMRAYMAIIVRGEEAKGVQVWSFGKTVYQRLLGFFTEEDVGDFLDPLTGFDLKVTLAPSPKKVDGRSFMDTAVDAARKQSKLHPDAEQMKKWLDAVPNIDDMYRQKTTAEIEQALNAWLAGGASDSGSSDEGTTRGDRPAKDELDRLVEDVKAPVVEAEAKSEKQKRSSAKKSQADIDDADVPVAKQSLDDAFEDLMKENNE